MHKVRRAHIVWKECFDSKRVTPRLCADYMCGNICVDALLCREPDPGAVLCDRCLGRPSPRHREDRASWFDDARSRLACST